MPADVLEVTKKFMREPIRILVKKEELTLEGIRQFYINVEKEVSLGFGSSAPSVRCQWTPGWSPAGFLSGPFAHNKYKFTFWLILALDMFDKWFAELCLTWCCSPGMEAGHTLWPVWNPDHHASCHLHQHEEESRLAHWEDARQGLHSLCFGERPDYFDLAMAEKRILCFDLEPQKATCGSWIKSGSACSTLSLELNLLIRPLLSAWWHGPERERFDHERVPLWIQSSPYHHWPAGMYEISFLFPCLLYCVLPKDPSPPILKCW